MEATEIAPVDKASVRAGQPMGLVATVTNRGANVASGYTVNILKDGDVIESFDGVDLETEQSFSYTFSAAFNASEQSQKHTLSVKVVFSGDLNADNDESEGLGVYVESADFLPAPRNLVADIDGDNVKIAFAAPDGCENPLTVTDSFEDYEDFSISGFGEWTVVDVDGQKTFAATESDEYDNMYAPQAFQVYRPSALGMNDHFWRAHSGNSYLMSFGGDGRMPNDLSRYDPAADNWLISPEITGGREVSFYVKTITSESAVGHVELLASATGVNLEDFSVVGKADAEFTGWTKLTYQLPDAARYFAVRFVLDGQGALMLDDLTYTRKSEEISLTGYNVYRNGELVMSIQSTDYVDMDAPKGRNTYNVTAVYNIAESQYSNDAIADFGNVDAVSDDGIVVVSDDRGAVITGLLGRNFSIVRADGVVLFSKRNAQATEVVQLSKGVYVLAVDGAAARKFVVR